MSDPKARGEVREEKHPDGGTVRRTVEEPHRGSVSKTLDAHERAGGNPRNRGTTSADEHTARLAKQLGHDKRGEERGHAMSEVDKAARAMTPGMQAAPLVATGDDVPAPPAKK